jgi:hypothetical protein
MGTKLVFLFLGAAFAAFVLRAQARLARVSARRSAATSARDDARKKREEASKADRDALNSHAKAFGYTAFAIITLFVIFWFLLEGSTSPAPLSFPAATPF